MELLSVLVVAAAGVVFLAIWALWRFHFVNRDPDRTPPAGAVNGVLAPADGTVLYVRRVEGEEAPIVVKQGWPVPFCKFIGRTGILGPGCLMGIFMHPSIIHVNRAPIAGTVRAIQHEPG
jgi:phosphatidylserine decarboxylase